MRYPFSYTPAGSEAISLAIIIQFFTLIIAAAVHHSRVKNIHEKLVTNQTMEGVRNEKHVVDLQLQSVATLDLTVEIDHIHAVIVINQNHTVQCHRVDVMLVPVITRNHPAA